MLVVGGTPGDDNIRLARMAGPSPGDVRVRMNGAFVGPFHWLGRVVVHGYGGDDTVWVNRQVTREAWLYGGDGDDALTGGQGANLILGGDGDDHLAGRNARDILIGGMGADRAARRRRR